MRYFIYILTNTQNTTLYNWVTNNLIKRIYEHKSDFVDGFSKKYKLHKLVYFKEYIDPQNAIAREKELKNWHRDWKINLVRSLNPELRDLYEDIV